MKKKTVLIAIVAIILASCNNATEETVWNGELLISSAISTRATEQTWEANDAIGVYMFTTATTTARRASSTLQPVDAEQAQADDRLLRGWLREGGGIAFLADAVGQALHGGDGLSETDAINSMLEVEV